MMINSSNAIQWMATKMDRGRDICPIKKKLQKLGSFSLRGALRRDHQERKARLFTVVHGDRTKLTHISCILKRSDLI